VGQGHLLYRFIVSLITELKQSTIKKKYFLYFRWLFASPFKMYPPSLFSKISFKVGRVEEDPEWEVRARVYRILWTAGTQAGGNGQTRNGNEEIKVGGRRKAIERGNLTWTPLKFYYIFLNFSIGSYDIPFSAIFLWFFGKEIIFTSVLKFCLNYGTQNIPFQIDIGEISFWTQKSHILLWQNNCIINTSYSTFSNLGAEQIPRWERASFGYSAWSGNRDLASTPNRSGILTTHIVNKSCKSGMEALTVDIDS
jgi:hypothetical protein